METQIPIEENSNLDSKWQNKTLQSKERKIERKKIKINKGETKTKQEWEPLQGTPPSFYSLRREVHYNVGQIFLPFEEITCPDFQRSALDTLAVTFILH